MRSFAANGTPMTDSLPFVTLPLNHTDSSPLVACDASGSCVAAWERQANDTATAALWLASFSNVAVESMIAESVGSFELTWEKLSSGNESLGVSGTQLNASALPVGSEYEIRGPWEETE